MYFDKIISILTSHLRNTSFHISNKEFDTSKTIKANNLLDRLLIRKEENTGGRPQGRNVYLYFLNKSGEENGREYARSNFMFV